MSPEFVSESGLDVAASQVNVKREDCLPLKDDFVFTPL